MNRMLLLATAMLLCSCDSNDDPLSNEKTLNLRTPESPPTVKAEDIRMPDAEKVEKPVDMVTVLRWSRPNTDEYRYYQIVDQTGCRWWMPMPGAEDDDGPDPVLGRNHRPACSDRGQEPDGELVEMEKEEAAAEIKAGRAVSVDQETLRRMREDEDQSDDDPAPTPSPKPSPTPNAIGRTILMPNGQMATTLGGGMVRMRNGSVAYHPGSIDR